MKRFISFIFCLTILSSPLSHAERVYYTIIDEINKTAAVRGSHYDDGPTGDIVIPERVEIRGEMYTVVAIPEEGFMSTRYSSIILPNTITSIGEAAFYYCPNLKEVTIGTGIRRIGRRPFQGCGNLKAITFLSKIPPEIHPNGVTEYVDHPVTIKTNKECVMDYACSYAISNGNEIYTFTSDRPLATYFDDNFEYLACDETKECIISKNLKPDITIENLTIPENVSISFGLASEEYKIVGIGSYVFGRKETYLRSEKLKGVVTMGNNIRCIGSGAFAGTYISELLLNENVRVIETEAFANCLNLTKVSFNQNLSRIGQAAFEDVPLTEIMLPKDLSLIGNYAFRYNEANRIEFNDSLLYIGYGAFCNSQVSKVILPDKLEEIGAEAFYGCESLTSVEFGRRLITVGAKAFMNTNLSSVNIPPSVQSLGNYAFRDCGIKQIYFEDGTYPVKIGEDAIGCDNLEYLYLGRDFSFNPATFKMLKKLEVGNLVSKIPDTSFKNSLRLTSVSIGSGLTEIGNEAFKYCSISDIILPSKIQRIGNECFAGNRLYSITIGAGITEIGEKAFEGNPNIALINITAQNPPKANVNTFTSYDARLNTDPRYSANYKNSDLCWSLFKQHELVSAEDIQLDCNFIKYTPGHQIQLSASILPADASLKTVLWESSDPDVAIVNTSGLVTVVDNCNTGVEKRCCQISAYTLYADSSTAICSIDENPHIPVSSITLDVDRIEGNVGENIQLHATVLPEDATNKVIRWSSSDEDIATVSQEGQIIMIKKGNAVIKASATDESGVSADCSVTVSEDSGIDAILTDGNTYVKVYDLKGILVYEGIYDDAQLIPGIYVIVCNGNKVKILIE